MKKADWILHERRRIARLYDEELQDMKGIELVKISRNIKSSYYKYIVYLKDHINRDYIKKEMKNRFNVELTGEVYAEPCHSQQVFKNYPEMMLNNEGDMFPGAEQVCNRHICLPLYPGLTEKEVRYVVSSLKCIISCNIVNK